VVVPTYERREVLARTLPTILDQELAPGVFEVVVVIDGSTDGTSQMLAERFADRPLRVLIRDNAGPAAARNAGIQAARGELVLLLDDDIICPPGLLAAHLAAHEVGRPAVAFGPVLGLEGTSTAAELTRRALAAYYARMRDEWHPDTSPTAYAAPNTSIPRDALVEAGGFDVRFAGAHEDADLGLRLRAMGLPFRYLPDVPVYQFYAKSAQDLATRDAAVHGRGEILLCRTHPALRRQSFLSNVAEGGALRRALREAGTRSPIPPDWLMRAPFEVAERLPPSWLRRTRLWLLTQRGHSVRLRAAAAAAGGWQALGAEFGRRCPALIYHHVGPAPPGMPPTLTTTPERFERQIRILHRQGFTSITAGRWLDWLEGVAPLPDRSFVLTFDDGYADLAEYAFPILRRYGFGATVFIVTSRIGGFNDWDASRGIAPLPLLDREQLRAWSREGIEFGAHTRTHADLTRLSVQELEREIAGSRDDLEHILGRPVRTFAYPFGHSNDAAVDCVRRHFDLAFSCIEGVNTLATDPHLQRRTMVLPSDTGLDLALRTRLGHSPLHALKARLRVRTRLRSLFGGKH
jgi:peptidoglycan/xylan/chitin deacetylase (PgdA/CDA1 family)/GT2 family glycosyltransferase